MQRVNRCKYEQWRRLPLTLGKYNGINAETFKPCTYDLTILANGEYEQNGETGKFSLDLKNRKTGWLTGPMPKQQLGFYYKAGDKFPSDGSANEDTIVIQDKKDVAEGNLRDVIWFNCCAK